LNQVAGTGTTTLNGAVNTNSAAGVTLTGTNLAVNAAITTTANGVVTFNESGTVAITSAGDINADGAVSITAGGGISTAGDVTTSNDNVTYASATTLTGPVAISTGAGAGNILFSSTLNGGQTLGLTAGTGNITFTGAMANGSEDVNITLDVRNVTQLEAPGEDRLYVTSQDGRAAGEMIDFNIDDTGRVIGVFSNGLLRTLGQLALAEFVNPAGLAKTGQNGWAVSGNSGDPQVVLAGDRSQITAGFLEMSNVDLTLEFSEMIRAQRGFQANSRVITSSDEMIQELVNLVR
jgi:flagellar hook-basal body protein